MTMTKKTMTKKTMLMKARSMMLVPAILQN